MPDDIHNRLSRAEWEIEALKEGYRQQGDKMADMTIMINAHHKELMDAVRELKDDRARAQGAAEARLIDSETRQNRLKWLSFGLAAIGTLIAL